MRSKATNMLQIVILLTGLVYLVIGIFFFISPLTVVSFFADNISENWLDLVKDHELVAPLYFYSRGISSLLFVTGLSMVMPLFDPLKYRGMSWQKQHSNPRDDFSIPLQRLHSTKYAHPGRLNTRDSELIRNPV